MALSFVQIHALLLSVGSTIRSFNSSPAVAKSSENQVRHSSARQLLYVFLLGTGDFKHKPTGVTVEYTQKTSLELEQLEMNDYLRNPIPQTHRDFGRLTQIRALFWAKELRHSG